MITEEKIKVMQAFVDGKQIQLKSKNDIDWRDVVPEPTWAWEKYDYRVKSEQKYVPYKNTEEMIEDYCKRFGIERKSYEEPLIWLMLDDKKLQWFRSIKL